MVGRLCATAPAASGNDLRGRLERTDETWVRLDGHSPTIVLQSGFGDGKAVWGA